jgi:hypothetical protein
VQTETIRLAYEALSAVPRTKGEFEPTAQFEQRRQAALTTLPSVIAVEKSLVHKFGDQYVRYNADKAAFEIKPGAFGEPPHICCASFAADEAVRSSSEADDWAGTSSYDIMFEFQKRALGQYTAHNAYGASVTVTRYREDFWGVLGGDLYKWEAKLPEASYRWFDKPLFTISSPIKQAPTLKETLRGVIYVSPRPPFTIEGRYVSKPTTQNKSEREMFAHYVVGTVDCFAVLDASGKILAQQAF